MFDEGDAYYSSLFFLAGFTFQGPVARSLVSANRWLRVIKMYRFPFYLERFSLDCRKTKTKTNPFRQSSENALTLVSTNHASSNPGQAPVAEEMDNPIQRITQLISKYLPAG